MSICEVTTTIYVRLLDEGTDVWRPVDAMRVSDGLYRLVGTHVDAEKWEFPSGNIVRVEKRKLSSGSEVVAAELAL